MEKARIEYRGKEFDLVKSGMENASTTREMKAERERHENPIFWIKLDDVNEEILTEVINIYSSVYNKNNISFEKPDFSDFSKEIVNKGYTDFDLLGKNSTPLEVRRRIGENGTVYLRFRTMPGGSTGTAIHSNPQREEFQDKVDSFLIEKNLAVRLQDTF